jgi:hypothetical protein
VRQRGPAVRLGQSHQRPAETLYPEHREIWDLLWKVGHFPDHLPILVAPSVHYWTLRFFQAIGAMAAVTTQQWFAPEPNISAAQFSRATSTLALPHSRQLNDPDQPSRALRNFFTKIVRKPMTLAPDREPLSARLERWQIAGEVCFAPPFQRLRDQIGGEERMALYHQALEELDEAGLDVDDFLPLE